LRENNPSEYEKVMLAEWEAHLSWGKMRFDVKSTPIRSYAKGDFVKKDDDEPVSKKSRYDEYDIFVFS
jgi:hypothetical protein